MGELSLSELVSALRSSSVFRGKSPIRAVAEVLGDRAGAIRNGDDAAALPDGEGFLLLAAEGIIPALVRGDPYLAGRCAVLANVNDIYAMGGRPLGMVDVVGTGDEASLRELCRGMRDGAARYQVPIVGGHVLRTSSDVSLSLAILGRARSLITSFDAKPGERIVLVTNLDGRWLAEHGYWNATLAKNDALLVPALELLPAAAEKGLLRAGKDVSMCGISGTVLMLAECSRVGARLELDRITPPDGVPLAPWLLAFMSYGFVLAVDPRQIEALAAPFRALGLLAADIGEFTAGSKVVLRRGGEEEVLWDHAREPFTGMGRP